MTARPWRQPIRLTFQPVGGPGEPYPAWVRALDGVSGVYAIREHTGDRVELAYIGESHTDRLYQTLTRHWQTWRRLGIGRAESEHDPGMFYARARCEAAALVTPAAVARCIQDALIDYLSPRDNLIRATRDSLADCPPMRLAITTAPIAVADAATPF